MSSASGFDFSYVCSQVALSTCALVNTVEPTCYSRNIELGTKLIFEPAVLVVNLIALGMTMVMIYHIKQKYTAVGRKEIILFFYLYAIIQLFEFLVVSNIVPIASQAYIYLVAIYNSLLVSTVWCLLLNGFVGFQWTEDGTPLSLWSIRLSTLLMFGISFFINIATFLEFAGFTKAYNLPLFVIHYIFTGAMIIIYVILQIILVVNTLDDRWPLGDILFGFSFFITAQVFQYVFSNQICVAANHYIDGMFFGSTFTLLSVMMVYKYWDSITREDLEFSVGGKSNSWELKNPLLNDQNQ